MSFTITYKVLFEVNIYHHYFLDDGEIAFDDSSELKQEQLNKYALDEFLTVVPSEKTLTKLIGHKIVMKNTSKGFVVLIKAEETAPDIYSPFISLKEDETFTFLLYIKDALFENYSTVPSNPTMPFHFTNVNLDEDNNDFKYINLEQSSVTAVEDYAIDEEIYEELSNELTSVEKQQLFGIITLQMKADEASHNILNNDGSIKILPTTFKIQIMNRSTKWVYNNAQDGSFIYSTSSAHPLVKHGIIVNNELEFEDKKLPSAIPNRLLFIKNNNGDITETISEIFI